jgi:hypothetical protein
MYSIALRLPLHGLRSRFLHWAYSWSYPVYARLQPKPRAVWQVSKEMLLECPPGSLGRYLGQFLQEGQLEMIPGFENHDVFHVLLDVGVSAPEEVVLQWCLIGNGKRSPFSLAAVAVGSLCFPEYWYHFRQAYRRGRSLRRFYHWYFEYLLQENLADMRRFLAGGLMVEEEAHY